MEVITIEKFYPGITPTDGLAKSKAKGLGMITNAEADEILNGKDEQYKQFKEYFACWTATHIEYKAGATEATVYNDGEKPTKIPFPLKDGWYECNNKWGIPNGAPSNSSNPKARYLWRYPNSDFNGFVLRRVFYFGVGGRRDVSCDGVPSYRFGVLAVKRSGPKASNSSVALKSDEQEFEEWYAKQSPVFDEDRKYYCGVAWLAARKKPKPLCVCSICGVEITKEEAEDACKFCKKITCGECWENKKCCEKVD